MSGSLRMSSWEDDIQLNREVLTLFGEMCVSQWALKSPRRKVSGEFGKSSGEKVEVENRVECF